MFNGKSSITMICTISFNQPLYQQIDSMRYITDIKDITFRDSAQNHNNSNKIVSIHEEYNNYINEVEWCACQERELSRKNKTKYYYINLFSKNRKLFRTKIKRNLQV